VTYFNINDAKKAFSKILEFHLNTKTLNIVYVYEAIPEKTLLSSIHESSDSNKSDKSDDGNDDTEKEKESHTPLKKVYNNYIKMIIILLNRKMKVGLV